MEDEEVLVVAVGEDVGVVVGEAVDFEGKSHFSMTWETRKLGEMVVCF